MASDFPAYAAREIERCSSVEEFTPGTAASEPSKVGSLVFYDITDATMDLCGADPALIAGIAEHDSVKGAAITLNGKVPYRLLRSGCIVAMCCATTYVEATHRGNSYGVVMLTSGNWAVDISDTSNTRVLVVGGDPDNGNIFYVTFIAANLQFDAIAS